MNEALQKFFRKGEPTPADVDTFIAENEFPLVEGSDVTFVYRGTAEAVDLRCWISGFAAAQAFQRLNDSDLWAVTIELPPGSRIEYKFEVTREGDSSLILDPLNDVIAHDPFGANSVCQGHSYERPSWTIHNPDARQGTVESRTLDSRVFGQSREIQVYLPARYRPTRRYPLLIVHDGIDYMRYAELTTVLDNLIQNLEIPALVVAMTQSPDRLKEYAADERHAEFIGNELLPHLNEHYPLIDEPRARGLMGASFGGVAALHSAWRNPE